MQINMPKAGENDLGSGYTKPELTFTNDRPELLVARNDMKIL